MNVRTAAIYIRVSTQQQSPENQEVESAAKARPVLDQLLLADARTGRIQAVAVWALDRMHRSMVAAIQTVLELDRIGVP